MFGVSKNLEIRGFMYLLFIYFQAMHTLTWDPAHLVPCLVFWSPHTTLRSARSLSDNKTCWRWSFLPSRLSQKQVIEVHPPTGPN